MHNGRFSIWNRNTLGGFLAGLAVSIGGAVYATADGDPATDNVPRVVPYQGMLELDGQAVHGSRGMRFSLYETGATEPRTALWTEEWSAAASKDCAADCPIEVRAGQFAVALGRHVDITPTIQNADDVCIGIAVQNGSDWVDLGGCQQITPAPMALWAAAGSNPVIAGDLTVNGQVQAGSVTTTTHIATDSRTAWLELQRGIYEVTKPTTSDMGLYSGASGAWMRYVTNNAPHKFYVDSSTNPNGQTAVLTVNSTGINVPGRVTAGELSAPNMATKGSYSQRARCRWHNINSGGAKICPASTEFVAGIEQEADCGDSDACVTQLYCCDALQR